MKKYVIFTLSVFMLLFLTLCGCSDMTDEIGGMKLRYDETLGGYTVVSYSGNDKSVTIPDNYNGMPVKAIGDHAFYGENKLLDITIGQNVISIGLSAMRACPALETVRLPASLVSFGNRALSDCRSLREITVDAGNTAYKAIDGVLYTSDGKTLIVYPEGKTDTEFAVPEGTETIFSNAFRGCSGLASVKLPESLVTIGEADFENCSGLLEIALGGTETIGTYAFCNCIAITEITIPDSVISIGERSFSNCIRLSVIIMGSGLRDIPGYAFSSCLGLQNAVIGDGVGKLSSYAFSGCTGIVNLTVPKSVNSIDSYAFSGCSGIKHIYYAGSASEWGNITVGYGNNYLKIASIEYNSSQNKENSEK